MNFEVVFSTKADDQLEKLQDYLAKRFYPANAERYVQRLTQACHSLAKAPYRGTVRNDLAPGLRTVGLSVQRRYISRLLASRWLSSALVMAAGFERVFE
jgi:toxin ParE1/3/4